MKGNAAIVIKYNIVKLNIVQVGEPHAITFTKWNIGPECSGIENQ